MVASCVLLRMLSLRRFAIPTGIRSTASVMFCTMYQCTGVKAGAQDCLGRFCTILYVGYPDCFCVLNSIIRTLTSRRHARP